MNTFEESTEQNLEFVVKKICREFGFEDNDREIDLRSLNGGQVFELFRKLIQTNRFVLHGTNHTKRFDTLEARQANDASKESGNKKAVYATTSVNVALALAVLNQSYLRTKFKSYTTGWEYKDSKWMFGLSPNVFELYKSGDPNLFSDGFVYILDKDRFQSADKEGEEWYSEEDQSSVLTCRVSSKLRPEVFGAVFEYSQEELDKMAERLKSFQSKKTNI